MPVETPRADSLPVDSPPPVEEPPAEASPPIGDIAPAEEVAKEARVKGIPIPAKETIVVPAQDEKTFPHSWISKLKIYSEPDSKAIFFLELFPYNQVTEEINTDQKPEIISGDLWRLLEHSSQTEDKKALIAMNAIFGAIEEIRGFTQN